MRGLSMAAARFFAAARALAARRGPALGWTPERQGGRSMSDMPGEPERLGPLRRVRLPDDVGGGLWLSAMPGRFEPLAAWTEAAFSAGIRHVAVLTGEDETRARSPAYSAALEAGLLPFTIHRHAIGDYSTPSDRKAFAALVQALAARLRAGEGVAVHCAAGIGRTGMTAQRLLIALGLDPDEAGQRVRAAGSSAETASQRRFGAEP